MHKSAHKHDKSFIIADLSHVSMSFLCIYELKGVCAICILHCDGPVLLRRLSAVPGPGSS